MYITKFFLTSWRNRKMQKLLNKAYAEDEIIAKLSYTFGVQFQKDWIGRVYAVINPVIRDGKFDVEQTLELTEMGYNNEEYTKKWAMERLIAMDTFLKTNNLFDMLSYKLDRVDEYGNYLFTLFPITLEPTLQAGRKALMEILGLSFLGIICWQAANLFI